MANLQTVILRQLRLACVILLVAEFSIYSNSEGSIEFRFLLTAGILLSISILCWWPVAESEETPWTIFRPLWVVFFRTVVAAITVIIAVVILPTVSANTFNASNPQFAFPLVAVLGMLVAGWRQLGRNESAVTSKRNLAIEISGWVCAFAGVYLVWATYQAFSPVESLVPYLALSFGIPGGIAIAGTILGPASLQRLGPIGDALPIGPGLLVGICVVVVFAAMLPLPIYEGLEYEKMYIALAIGSILGALGLIWHVVIGNDHSASNTKQLLPSCGAWALSIAVATALNEGFGFTWYYMDYQSNHVFAIVNALALLGVSALYWWVILSRAAPSRLGIRISLEIVGRAAAITATSGILMVALGLIDREPIIAIVYFFSLILGAGVFAGLALRCDRRANAETTGGAGYRSTVFEIAYWLTGYAAFLLLLKLLIGLGLVASLAQFMWTALVLVVFFGIAYWAWRRERYSHRDIYATDSLNASVRRHSVRQERVDLIGRQRQGPFSF